MISDQEFNRIRWASRRGMLELDLILGPFVEERLKTLDEQDIKRYLDLLDSEDNDLFAWFLGHRKPEDAELVTIVNKILTYVRPTRD
ncbi:MAG: antitoxin CptB [Pseudohongiellaceae bacterium]|jgi:antitoxin CptB